MQISFAVDAVNGPVDKSHFTYVGGVLKVGASFWYEGGEYKVLDVSYDNSRDAGEKFGRIQAEFIGVPPR